MPEINDLKGLDRVALFVVAEKIINDGAGDKLEPVMQYWTAQSNTSVVLATVFATIGSGFMFQLHGVAKLIAIPSFVVFMYFALKTWAYGRCARIACSLWK